MNATKRFVLRVTELLAERKQTQKSLRGENSEAWISNIVKLRRALKLDDADDIATALDVPLSELVRRPEDVTYELDGTEARLLDAYRQLAPVEQQALITLATLRTRRIGRPSKKVQPNTTKRLNPTSGGRKVTESLATLSPGGSLASGRVPSSLSPDVQRLVSEFEGRIAELLATEPVREQAPAPRDGVASALDGHRSTGRSGSSKAR